MLGLFFRKKRQKEACIVWKKDKHIENEKKNEIHTHKLTHSPCGNQEDKKKRENSIQYNNEKTMMHEANNNNNNISYEKYERKKNSFVFCSTAN